MKIKNLLLGSLFLVLASSCSDEFLEKDFGSEISDQQLADLANSNPEAVLSLAEGIEGGNYFFLNDFTTATGHTNMHDEFGHMGYGLGLDLMSNDMVQTLSHWFSTYYNYNARRENNLRTDAIWQFYYKVVFNMNDGLKYVPSTVTADNLKFIRGRMLAMRAFAYFHLVRIYGNGELGIPVYTVEQALSARQPVEDVKALILADLTEAHTLLTGYTRTSKVSVDKKIVSGFLARYYLEYATNSTEYNLAAQYAIEARGGLMPMDATQLFDGFNKITNTEWMWGADINTATSTYYASFFSQIGNLNPGYAGLLNSHKAIDRRIYDNISSTDLRKDWFVLAGNPYGISPYSNVKFIDDTDFEGDYVFMRAAEMYLIEAEAYALAGNETAAKQALLNLVSTRDASYTGSVNSGSALLDEIRLHRKIELWGEGFAFYDMKRLSMPLNRTYSGSNHASFGYFDFPSNSEKFNFQIPLSEVNANTELGAQNPF